MKKNLSNNLTLEVLEIVGLSNIPLSSREIEKRWFESKFKSKSILDKKKTNSQIYLKINEISGKKYYKTDSISYNDFIDNLNDSNYKLKLLKIIDKIFPIDNKSTKIRKDDNYDINKSIKLKDEFDSTNKKGYLKIHVIDKSKFGFDNAVIYVDLNLEEVSLSISGIDDEINNKYSQRGILRKDDYNPDNFDISFDKNNINPPFLDISLKESKQEEIKNIQKDKKIVSNQKTLKKKGYDNIFFGVLSQEESKNIFSNIDYITQIQNDPANFRYSLNLRGFLHYLIHTKQHKKVDKIIENLLRNKEVIDQYYFLNHIKSIELIVGGKKNRIDILQHIARELEGMLDYSSILELRHESTKRYFSKINRIISQFPGLSIRSIGDEDEYRKWIDYKLRILKSIIGYEKKLLSIIHKELSFTEKQRRQIENINKIT